MMEKYLVYVVKRMALENSRTLTFRAPSIRPYLVKKNA